MAKVTKKRSIGYYTEALNTGTEYAVREDLVVFVRERYWAGRFFATTKWTRTDTFTDELKKLKALPERHIFGFGSRGAHIFVETCRLRLPQD